MFSCSGFLRLLGTVQRGLLNRRSAQTKKAVCSERSKGKYMQRHYIKPTSKDLYEHQIIMER
eukprot:11407264-Ditylum_brightwellii.AAC.1